MERNLNYMIKKRLVSIVVLTAFITSAFCAVQTNAAGKVKLNKNRVSLEVGKTVKLKLCGNRKKVRWISKKKAVATVSGTGKVRAEKVGTAQIVAKASGKKYKCKVTVIRKNYTFRSDALLEEHYQKHGVIMGFATKEAYVSAANVVIYSPNVLHKLEAEDGDDVYYLEAGNELVIVSADGYIRTYFCPDDGRDYFNRQ